MKPTNYMLLLVLLLNACAPLSSLQKVVPNIPCVGAVGKTDTKLFKKAFHKIGEPQLNDPISVSMTSTEFNKATFNNYRSYMESVGKPISLKYVDSVENKPRYYKLVITDNVGLKAQLNSERNTGLKEYLINDDKYRLLTGISFVADEYIDDMLSKAEHVFVVQADGMLTLEAHGHFGHTIVKMSLLQVFDYETSGFCWKNNTYGRPEIAVIVSDRESCPRSTEKSPDKLNDTKAYLKF